MVAVITETVLIQLEVKTCVAALMVATWENSQIVILRPVAYSDLIKLNPSIASRAQLESQVSMIC